MRLVVEKRLKRRRRAGRSAETLAPTAERLTHDIVEALANPIVDSLGTISRPHHVVDVLASLIRRGAISPAMFAAGEEFRAAFRVAGLDMLHAADLSRVMGNTNPPGAHGIARAREHVWRSVQACGGIQSAGGSCLWNVLGWEMSLREWAASQEWALRSISAENATGVLIGALGVLAGEKH